MATFGPRLTAGCSGCPSRHWFRLDTCDHADSGEESTSASDRMALRTDTQFVSLQPAMTLLRDKTSNRYHRSNWTPGGGVEPAWSDTGAAILVSSGEDTSKAGAESIMNFLGQVAPRGDASETVKPA